MAQTRPSPTLSRGFTRLGRFLAPDGQEADPSRASRSTPFFQRMFAVVRVRLEFVVRPPLGAGPSPGSGRSNGHCSARYGPPCGRQRRSTACGPSTTRGCVPRCRRPGSHRPGRPPRVTSQGGRAALAVDRLRLASAEVVKEATGYWPGGVPPIGHRQPLEVVIDRRVFDHDIGGCVATFQKRQESSWRRAPAASGFDGCRGSKVLKFRIISSDKSAD